MITIKYIPYIDKIIATINDNIIFDNSFNGGFLGFKSLENGTVFSNVVESKKKYQWIIILWIVSIIKNKNSGSWLLILNFFISKDFKSISW